MTKTKKRRPSDCKVCSSGKYKLEYDSNAPVFVCDGCGDKETTWHKFYNNYLDLFRTKSNWESKKNQISCIMGFFCYKYEEFYGVKYVFVPKNPNPYSSKESRDAWQLLAAFGGNAHEVRRYIHWVFKKGINKNITMTSFGYITTPGLIRRYNLYSKKRRTYTRSSKLPGKFLEWCSSNVPSIFDKYELTTMNDLGSLIQYVSHYGVSPDSPEQSLISEASKVNLIKNGKLNIGEK